MASECLSEAFVTPDFLRSACELPDEDSRELIRALRLFMENPGWWANDRSHAQANSWLAVGWQATALNPQEEIVTFVRKPAYGKDKIRAPHQSDVCR